MTRNSLHLDAEIVYYETLSNIIQHKRNFLKNRINVMPKNILVMEVHV